VFLEVVFKFGGPSSDLHEHRVQFHIDRAAVAANEIESRLDVGYWHLGGLPAKDLGDLFVDLVASTWLVGDWCAALEEVGQVLEGVAERCFSKNCAFILQYQRIGVSIGSDGSCGGLFAHRVVRIWEDGRFLLLFFLISWWTHIFCSLSGIFNFWGSGLDNLLLYRRSLTLQLRVAFLLFIN
jgi:hypothetical protein